MSEARYSNCKGINRIVRGLIREGWTFGRNPHGHPHVTSPGGTHFIVFSSTPSDGNAHRQFERDVRRLKQRLAQENIITNEPELSPC